VQFIDCPDLGGWIDCRDLVQVFEHEGPLFEVENFLMDALNLSRMDGPAIKDARLVALFLLRHAADPVPDAVTALRARRRTPSLGNHHPPQAGHEAGAPKLILAATLLDLALQLITAEQAAEAEQTVRSFANNFFAPPIDLH
jgi:hypothetical protein